ncbi:hypothetical protein FJ417_27910 [Mesorhizobium sp. B3-1-7]|uniref:hypothetical protein n=1 Tax=Mesorhizobium sp. B3-1-7 TaxID=2589894 RepID=UPI0011678B3E|nr:hypothetical protein [Mesorhizobium sp. B3-1-7]TPI51584.1 hypothetical protein FJ417_27910 [Mesorhizobium sp. B3-1-7]
MLDIYRETTWLGGESARVRIANDGILDTFQLVEVSDRAEADANLAALVDLAKVKVGDTIQCRVGSPRLSLGVLADDWDTFLSAPDARIREPNAYFIKEDESYKDMAPPSPRVANYRSMLDFIKLLANAALFLDVERQTLVYFKDKKVEIPIRFSAANLSLLDGNSLNALREALDGKVHSEQRLAIFSDAILTLATSQAMDNRFLYLTRNVDELSRRVTDGYRLFASSFSYTKIRGDVEAAQSDYIGRIHKTFVDIQSQLLGLPVATVVVATQLKDVSGCGVAAWANFAVIGGAWLFALLLIGSCINQWFTLAAIKSDLKRQRLKLTRDFYEISAQFNDIFDGLARRISWYIAVLTVIGCVAIGGAAFATLVFEKVTDVDLFSTCMP